MAVTFGFYDSLNHDRTYSTLQFSSIFDGIISDGIYATFLDALQVTASDPTGLSVIVKPGRAWFNHTWTLNDASLILTVENPNVLLSRIDTVVLEVSSGINSRENRIYILAGTATQNPVPPTLSHGTNNVYQYPLANILVNNETIIQQNGGIRQEDIIDRRGSSDTPFVSGIIDTIDIDNLTAQWASQFDRMFTELEVQIAQAAAQTLIDGSVTTQKIASHAVSYEYNGTLLAGSDQLTGDNYWTEDGGLYTQTIVLSCPAYVSNELLTTDSFIVDTNLSNVSDPDILLEITDAWGGIKRCYCSTQNQLTFVFDNEPDINIPIKALGIRR